MKVTIKTSYWNNPGTMHVHIQTLFIINTFTLALAFFGWKWLTIMTTALSLTALGIMITSYNKWRKSDDDNQRGTEKT